MGKRFWKWTVGIVLTAVLVIGGLAGYYHFLCRDTWVGSVRYDRSEKRVDLSGAPLGSLWGLQYFEDLEFLDMRNTGMTHEQHAQILGWHPACEILWSVPFQNGYVDSDSGQIRISSLSEADFAAFSDLPRLTTVDASKCQDYGALASLASLRPDLDIQYSVILSGRSYDLDSEEIQVINGSTEELLDRLQYLPALKEITLQGKLPTSQEVDTLHQTYPELQIHWVYRLGPARITDADTEAVLSDIKLASIEPVEDLLKYGSALETIELVNCGLTNEDLRELQNRFPEVRLIWDVTVAGRNFRTDVTEIDISGIPVTDPAGIEEMLPYLPDLKKVIMCDCGLSNEEMDALDLRHEDVKFVWMVDLAGKARIRTDEIYFMPWKLDVVVRNDELRDLKYCRDMVCIDVGHMPITNCEFVRTMPNLKYLIIADTYISSIEPVADLKELIYFEAFLTYVTDYSPLLECPKLEDLNLCFTGGKPEPLTQMKQLKRLWWGFTYQGKPLPHNYLTMLKEALPDTQVVFYGYSTGFNWRDNQNYRDMRDILGMYYMQ